MDNCQGEKYCAVCARGKSVRRAETDGLLTLKIAAIKSPTRKDGAIAPAEPIPHMIRSSSLQEDERTWSRRHGHRVCHVMGRPLK